MISHEKFQSCHIYSALGGTFSLLACSRCIWQAGIKDDCGTYSLLPWNHSLHIVCLKLSASLGAPPRTPTPSLPNYLCLSELELSRDSSDNREALLHYGEVSRGFCVVRQEGGWHLSCEWDHWVGGNFGPRWRALVRGAFLLTCQFPQLSLVLPHLF